MSRNLNSDSPGIQQQNAGYYRSPFQPPQSSGSPRPPSTGSNHSCSSCKGPRPKQAICVGEEVKIAINIALDRFRMNEEQTELEFPSSLTATERAFIHRLCGNLGLKSKSKGKGSTRYLTILKKDGSHNFQSTAPFQLVRNSRHNIHSLLQRFPVTNKEKQELLPRTDRSIPIEGMRELNKTTTGKLNNGVQQIPPKAGVTELLSVQRTLPVYNRREEIIKLINQHQVVLISGETGSGKTTQVPQMILNQSWEKQIPCRIFCTQPRRISALSVAERVASERGEKIGQTVGYQIRLESKVSPKTLLTFCTNGVLLRTLMGGENALSTVTHVIVDEVHERDRFSDFLLIALRQLLSRFKHLKVVLMSATLNTELFVQYFGNCPIVRVPGQLHEVKEYYLEDILKWTGYTNKKMEQYKKEQEKEKKHIKQLEEWCSMDLLGETKHMEIPEQTKERLSETSTEKEEVEPWLATEMDNLLSEAFLGGDESVFTQIFHLIMSENVSVDYTHSETGATPLMIGAGRGFNNVLETLLNLGASTNIRTSNDWTALDWAKKFKQTEAIELLESYMSSETSTSDEITLDKAAENIDPAEKELLKIYHHSFDDEKVDLGLIASLLYKVHSNQREGAILVFLPGYDEIVTLREMILTGDKRFMDSNRYILYTLHSAMQSSDQKQVFKNPPPGVRKIILSTNLAETSVTINDVVFVIDSGKVKEKSYDALTSVSMLKTNWVSKANAKQRKGRAGRCQAGVCYHLFSRVRCESMQEFQEPELLRYPLQEVCLHTKLLAPVGCPIADYLAMAPQPPAYLVTRSAVQILKQIDALDPFEDLTELGQHLSDLPLEPRLGKMVLYSVVLKCLDPVLTVACALAYKDPFMLPAIPSQRRTVNLIRRKFASGTFSDHMALLRVFQGWQRARSDGWEKAFCEKNYLSAATMEMIVGMRTQLLGQLRASGFVRARGGGDIRDLNTNSENWSVVKAALCAGTYPNLMKVNRSRTKLTTVRERNVRLHTASVLSPAPTEYSRENTQKESIRNLPTDWVIFDEMTRNERLAHVRCSTVVSPVTVFLFAGPAKLSMDVIREAELGISLSNSDNSYTENSSGSETEEKVDIKKSTLNLEQSLSFRGDIEAINLALQLRQKWHSLMMRRMRAPSKPWSQVDENVVRSVINVLTSEEQALGLQQPAGIGQRPRPMTTDYVMSGGSSRRGSYDTEPSDDSSAESKPGNFKTGKKASPFKRRELFSKLTLGDDCSETSSVRSGNSLPGSGNNSTTGSLKGSATSSPCASPQPASSPARITEGVIRYFVMRCNSFKQLDVSCSKGLWVTTVSNEKKLSRAFKEGKTIYLIFSVHGSGQFQGYAKMTTLPSRERVPEFSFPGAGGSFNIEWIKRYNIQFQQSQHIVNPWNDHRKIQISRDGQEVQSAAAEQLLKLWENK